MVFIEFNKSIKPGRVYVYLTYRYRCKGGGYPRKIALAYVGELNAVSNVSPAVHSIWKRKARGGIGVNGGFYKAAIDELDENGLIDRRVLSPEYIESRKRC